MEEYYNYIKALHLIFVITWFAGLFYVPRLFIYHIEATEKPEPDKSILVKQLQLMTKRLWNIITWPSVILATLFAVVLFFIHPYLLYQDWMWVKLFFVVLLIIYHIKTHFIYKQFQQGIVKYTSHYMRVYNEGPTMVLFAVIFIVFLKSAYNWIFGLIGLVGLAVLLMLGIRLYKKVREKNPEA